MSFSTTPSMLADFTHSGTCYRNWGWAASICDWSSCSIGIDDRTVSFLLLLLLVLLKIQTKIWIKGKSNFLKTWVKVFMLWVKAFILWAKPFISFLVLLYSHIGRLHRPWRPLIALWVVHEILCWTDTIVVLKKCTSHMLFSILIAQSQLKGLYRFKFSI